MEATQIHMPSHPSREKIIPPPKRFRPRILLPLVALVAVFGLFYARLGHIVFQNAALANPAPSPDVIEELISQSPDPAAAIVAAWNTDQIVHRQVAIREIGRSLSKSTNLPPALQSIVLAGALDPDNNVREDAMNILSRWPHPAFASLAAAQLSDSDPQVRLLGLHAAKSIDARIAIPLVAPLLNEADPMIVSLALKIIEKRSGEKFGASLSGTAPIENATTGLKEFSEEGLTKAREAAIRGNTWWTQHKNEFPLPHLEIPPEVLAARRKVPARNFSLTSLDGHQVNLAGLKGKVVLINFWTTWCTACISEMPELVALQKRHGDQLAILGVSLDYVPDSHGHIGGHSESEGEHADDEQASLKKIRQKVAHAVNVRNLNYTVLLDEKNEIGGRFNGGELPTTVIIDADGNVRRRFVGARSLSVFEAMLAEASRPGS